MKTAKRLISAILALLTVVLLIPFAVTATAENGNNKVSDPSTMDDWKLLFGKDNLSTEYAGGVWTDKSVFTTIDAFNGTGITWDEAENSFLVALSAISSTESVKGVASVPTDTIMVLDISSSMYPGREPYTVQTMLNAVNESILNLQNLNENNRVGVVIYYGGENRLQSTSESSMVLLPLDRYYNAENKFLVAGVTNNLLQMVKVNSNVTNSNNQPVTETSRAVTDVAGTYAQMGVLDALAQFEAADTTVPVTAEYQPGANRVPIMIFMSDGEPTAATHQYTQKADAGMGNNTLFHFEPNGERIPIRNANETDFVTQLTLGYTHDMIDAHYVETEPIIYTLSLGNSISLAVMDPDGNDGNGVANTSDTIKGYWNSLITNGSVGITVTNSPDAWSKPSVVKNYTVEKTTVNGVAFPQSIEQMNYVDETFNAEDANALTDVFKDIVNKINIRSEYHPTLVSGSSDFDGYITFTDNIGEYMEVTSVKGLLINDRLFSGADIASNFVTGGGDLGSKDEPTSLGDQMVWAVQQRIGIENIEDARSLINQAYFSGQLSYVSDTEFSNYIGWYANAKGEYLGFYQEGVTVLPESTGNVDTDPCYTVKSYGYLGAVDEAHGVKKSDMMYATVQVRESIANGEQTVTFAVPASLIPLVQYEIILDKEGNPEEFTVSGAESPIRLVYEVSLKEGINADTINDPNVVSPEYVANNSNSDGSVNFYSNKFEADHSTGYGKDNTLSYFRPARENSRYYFRENALICIDQNGTPYQSENAPGTVSQLYFPRHIYVSDGTTHKSTYVYDVIAPSAIATAKANYFNMWYVPAGTVQTFTAKYNAVKTENKTNTLLFSDEPFVDIYGHNVSEENHRFVVGSTLGNNGRLTITPSKLDFANAVLDGKKLLNGRNLVEGEFEFNLIDTATNEILETVKNDADGNFQFTALSFDNAGEFEYKIVEVNNGIEGITYDTTEYTAAVSVANENGKLVANVEYSVGDEKAEKVEFKNSYNPNGISVDIEIEKTVVNNTDKEFGPDGFKFQIKQDGKVISEAVSDKNGKAVFTLNYTKDHIGKTFKYQVSEVNEGVVNLVYDETVYEYTVTVSADENGNPVAVVAKDGKTDDLVAKFVNTANPPPKPGDNGSFIPVAIMMLFGGLALFGAVKAKKNRF